MKKIKILRIIARLNIGGPAIHTILLTEGLDKNRFDSLLVYGSADKDEGDMLYRLLEKNIKLIFIPELKRQLNFFNDIAAFSKIYHIIKAEQPEIIHTHTAKAGTLGRLAGILYSFFNFPKCRRINLIHTFHGHIFEGYFSRFETGIFVLIERFLALFTSRLITVSEAIKKQLIDLHICNENKIEVIPLGIELEGFLSIPIRDNPVANIGIVGRLVPIKNHYLFLDAASKTIFNNQGMQLRFKIIGDGELRQDLERYSRKLNIDEQIDFLGWQRDLVNVYTNLDIAALTSINEGTPVSLVEAMASGRVVVATDVGGVRDLLGKELDNGIKVNANFQVLERGIIVEPGDSYSFADALIYVLQNNKLRKRIGTLARDFVKTRFTRERLIKDMDALYGRLLNS